MQRTCCYNPLFPLTTQTHIHSARNYNDRETQRTRDDKKLIFKSHKVKSLCADEDFKGYGILLFKIVVYTGCK
jgi:hypothetical protein